MWKPLAAAAAAMMTVFGAAYAQTGKVTVVTSFSKDVTDPFKRAFEKAHPGVTLDVQNRNTNAAVRFIEETRNNNQIDLMWASAPDAFEVLKNKKLLQPFKPKGGKGWKPYSRPSFKGKAWGHGKGYKGKGGGRGPPRFSFSQTVPKQHVVKAD